MQVLSTHCNNRTKTSRYQINRLMDGAIVPWKQDSEILTLDSPFVYVYRLVVIMLSFFVTSRNVV